jgi:hypothetical protein
LAKEKEKEIKEEGQGMKKSVAAPKGFHWMKKGASYKLMKDPSTGYKAHKGASKKATFEVQKVHKKG